MMIGSDIVKYLNSKFKEIYETLQNTSQTVQNSYLSRGNILNHTYRTVIVTCLGHPSSIKSKV